MCVLKVQSTSPKSPLFWHYSPRWSALWARLRSQRATAGVSGSQCGWRADVSLWCASRGSARARADPHAVFFQKSQVIWVSSLLLGIEKTAEFQRSHFNFQKVYMGIACDISEEPQHETPQRHHEVPQAEDNASPEDPDSRHNRHKHGGTAPDMGHCTRYVAVHPLRGTAPVTWRCTRTEEVHCLRIGCSAPTYKNKRGTGTPNHSPPHPSMRSWALLVAGRARRPRHHLHPGPLRHLPHPYMRRAGYEHVDRSIRYPQVHNLSA